MVRDTSYEAYRRIRDEGLLSKSRLTAYEIVFEHGPLTANEVGVKVEETFGKIAHRHNYNARCGELRDLGVLVEAGERACSVTGYTAILWDVTSKLPRDQSILRQNAVPSAEALLAASTVLWEAADDAQFAGRAAQLQEVAAFLERRARARKRP